MNRDTGSEKDGREESEKKRKHQLGQAMKKNNGQKKISDYTTNDKKDEKSTTVGTPNSQRPKKVR